MGFGTFFIGYFLLLNITYYAFTDIIASLVMLLGLYKLSGINRPFRLGAYACSVFALFSLIELVIAALDMFGFSFSGEITTYFAIIRYAAVATVSLCALLGIKEVCREVDLPVNAGRANLLTYTALTVYTLLILLEMPFLTNIIPVKVTAAIASVILILQLVYIIFTLILIYSCHIRICMPEDELPKEEKPSKFAFVNEYKRRKAEKDRQYQEYKLEKKKKGQKKK